MNVRMAAIGIACFVAGAAVVEAVHLWLRTASDQRVPLPAPRSVTLVRAGEEALWSIQSDAKGVMDYGLSMPKYGLALDVWTSQDGTPSLTVRTFGSLMEGTKPIDLFGTGGKWFIDRGITGVPQTLRDGRVAGHTRVYTIRSSLEEVEVGEAGKP